MDLFTTNTHPITVNSISILHLPYRCMQPPPRAPRRRHPWLHKKQLKFFRRRKKGNCQTTIKIVKIRVLRLHKFCLTNVFHLFLPIFWATYLRICSPSFWRNHNHFFNQPLFLLLLCRYLLAHAAPASSEHGIGPSRLPTNFSPHYLFIC